MCGGGEDKSEAHLSDWYGNERVRSIDSQDRHTRLESRLDETKVGIDIAHL